jgi:hypothetical protein
MGPYYCVERQHPDTTIKVIGPLLDNTQDTLHRVAIFSSTPQFIQHKSSNKTYILHEQLHAMELCIYHGLIVEVDGLEGERISQLCQRTGSQSRGGRNQQNDWVWEMQCPRWGYGVQNGHHLRQLRGLFRIQLQNGDGDFVEFWLALALTTRPEISDNWDTLCKFV